MELDELQMNIISNYLANFHDWPIEDIFEDFKTYLDENEISLSIGDSTLLIASFLKLDEQERFNRSFDHFNFVNNFSKPVINQNIS
jgi:hypothetical protein